MDRPEADTDPGPNPAKARMARSPSNSNTSQKKKTKMTSVKQFWPESFSIERKTVFSKNRKKGETICHCRQKCLPFSYNLDIGNCPSLRCIGNCPYLRCYRNNPRRPLSSSKLQKFRTRFRLLLSRVLCFWNSGPYNHFCGGNQGVKLWNIAVSSTQKDDWKPRSQVSSSL